VVFEWVVVCRLLGRAQSLLTSGSWAASYCRSPGSAAPSYLRHSLKHIGGGTRWWSLVGGVEYRLMEGEMRE